MALKAAPASQIRMPSCRATVLRPSDARARGHFCEVLVDRSFSQHGLDCRLNAPLSLSVQMKSDVSHVPTRESEVC